MPKHGSSYVKCRKHGKRVAAVVCCHMIDSADPVRFVENNSDPEDLQVWCDKCEQFFLAVGEMTDEIVAFNDFAFVCCDCYEDFKKHHASKRKTKYASRKHD
jgi:hypothetical protein